MISCAISPGCTVGGKKRPYSAPFKMARETQIGLSGIVFGGPAYPHAEIAYLRLSVAIGAILYRIARDHGRDRVAISPVLQAA